MWTLKTTLRWGVGLLEGNKALPIGIGRYIVDANSPKRAEVAFTVDDNFQGIGVGSLLLKHLIWVARQRGIEEFFATVLPNNEAMIRVFKNSRLPLQETVSSEFVEISLFLTSTTS